MSLCQITLYSPRVHSRMAGYCRIAWTGHFHTQPCYHVLSQSGLGICGQSSSNEKFLPWLKFQVCTSTLPSEWQHSIVHQLLPTGGRYTVYEHHHLLQPMPARMTGRMVVRRPTLPLRINARKVGTWSVNPTYFFHSIIIRRSL